MKKILTTAVMVMSATVSYGQPFQVMETTIDQVHAAFKSGKLTARQLVQAYLDRI